MKAGLSSSPRKDNPLQSMRFCHKNNVEAAVVSTLLFSDELIAGLFLLDLAHDVVDGLLIVVSYSDKLQSCIIVNKVFFAQVFT